MEHAQGRGQGSVRHDASVRVAAGDVMREIHGDGTVIAAHRSPPGRSPSAASSSRWSSPSPRPRSQVVGPRARRTPSSRRFGSDLRVASERARCSATARSCSRRRRGAPRRSRLASCLSAPESAHGARRSRQTAPEDRTTSRAPSRCFPRAPTTCPWSHSTAATSGSSVAVVLRQHRRRTDLLWPQEGRRHLDDRGGGVRVAGNLVVGAAGQMGLQVQALSPSPVRRR